MESPSLRRPWQFGLSTLLAAMILCGALAWLWTALVVSPYQEEQAVIAAIERSGGRVATEALGGKWLDLVGSRYGQRAVTVHLVGPAVDDALLAQLHQLVHLKKLWLVETATSPDAIRGLERADLEIHMVQGFPIHSTRDANR